MLKFTEKNQLPMYKTKHSSADHTPDNGILTLHLHDSVDSDEILKTELIHLVAAAKKHNVKKILIHNKDLNHPLNGDLQKWAESNIELALLTNGVDKIAIVRPESDHVFALTNHNDTQRKRYFDSDADAMAWLNE